MRWLDRIFTRSDRCACFESVPPAARPRLRDACRSLSEAERAVQSRLRLSVRPRLVLVDEERAVIITPEQRKAFEAGGDGPA